MEALKRSLVKFRKKSRKQKINVLNFLKFMNVVLIMMVFVVLGGWQVKQKALHKLSTVRSRNETLKKKLKLLRTELKQLNTTLALTGGEPITLISAEELLEKLIYLKDFTVTKTLSGVPKAPAYIVWTSGESFVSYHKIKEVEDYLKRVFGQRQIALIKPGPPVVFALAVEP